eukprot:3743185-Karenia_brevis.AAC.1
MLDGQILLSAHVSQADFDTLAVTGWEIRKQDIRCSFRVFKSSSTNTSDDASGNTLDATRSMSNCPDESQRLSGEEIDACVEQARNMLLETSTAEVACQMTDLISKATEATHSHLLSTMHADKVLFARDVEQLCGKRAETTEMPMDVNGELSEGMFLEIGEHSESGASVVK